MKKKSLSILHSELLSTFKEYEIKSREVKNDKDLCLRWGADSNDIGKYNKIDCPYLDRHELLCRRYYVPLKIYGFRFSLVIRYRWCRLSLNKRRA